MHNNLRIQRRYDLLQLPLTTLAERLDELCERALDNLTDKNKGSLRSMFRHATSVTELIDYTWVLSHRLKIPYEGQDFTLQKVSAALESKLQDTSQIENIRNYTESTKTWRAEADKRGLFEGHFLKRTFDAVRAARLSKELGIIKPK